MFKNNKKNFIILVSILIITILLSLIVTKINFTIQKNKINNSPLAKVVKNYKLEDIDQLLLNESFILFVGYSNDISVYNLEKELIPIIKNNDLENIFYYLDFTEYKNNSDMLNILNDKLNTRDKKIKYLPALIYFKNNRTYGIVSNLNSNQVFDISEAYQLLDINGLLKND